MYNITSTTKQFVLGPYNYAPQELKAVLLG